MQRRPFRQETSRQQCSGSHSGKKHRGNNAAEANPAGNIAVTMQRRPFRKEASRQQCSGGQSVKKHCGNNAAEVILARDIAATMFPDSVSLENLTKFSILVCLFVRQVVSSPNQIDTE
jgi:hypothetical protein